MSDRTARQLAEVVGLDLLIEMGLADEDEQRFDDDSQLPVLDPDLVAILNQLMEVQSTRRNLIDRLVRVQETAQRTIAALNAWQHVNSLGVLQAEGSQIDVACATYELEARQLTQACKRYAARRAQDVAAAVLGGDPDATEERIVREMARQR